MPTQSLALPPPSIDSIRFTPTLYYHPPPPPSLLDPLASQTQAHLAPEPSPGLVYVQKELASPRDISRSA
jgi:hypothetical protein